MPKLRIVEPGWHKFNDFLGSVKFTDGVSDEEVSRKQAEEFGLSLRVEFEDEPGYNPSPSQTLLDFQRTNHSELNLPVSPIDVQKAEELEEVVEDFPEEFVEVEEAPAPVVVDYDEASLRAVAKDAGIKGLREIADPLGIKDAQIAGMIGQLLRLKEKLEAK